MRKTYDIVKEPQGNIYKALIDYCSIHARCVLLVIRDADWIEPSINSFMEKFQVALISREQATEWPGTKLLSGTATVFRYNITPDMVKYLKTEVDGLYEWKQPKQLEDISFIRHDASTLLATIAHENDAYMELTSQEYSELLQLIPGLF
jgi:hypothetical protein